MSNTGLSNNRLEELRRQREEERKRKQEEQQRLAEQQAQQQVASQPEPQAQPQVEQPTQPEPKVEPQPQVQQEEIVVKAEQEDLQSKRQSTTSSVNIVGEDAVLVQSSTAEEDGKVQVGYTMVDESLVKEAKDNKRYGIKERSELYRRLNTIVFFVAIPFMIVWIVLAFAGICTMKVGYPSFANNIYYTVDETTAVKGYEVGDVLEVKSDGGENAKSGYIVCVEYNKNGNKSLHLLKVVERLDSNLLRVIMENNNDEVLRMEGYSSTEPHFLHVTNEPGNGMRYIGIVQGKDIFLGKFIIFSQNIVAFIFIVIVPLAIILTFQVINLYDGIRIYRIQKKIAKSTIKKTDKPVEDKDKIVR